ncbi:His Kinase A (phospho-acceptor) domain-containing protein [Ruminococcaceae bacterium KH2T8]|nr:His Kinase A (phospho-acceptor) domain-containing protein [Ruminococcaceae bacterium KH2T8]
MSLVVLLIVVVASLGLGYMVGINQFNKKIDSDIDEVIKRLKYEGAVSASIIDNVGLGVIAYDRNGVVYSNHTIDSLAEFLPNSTDGKSLKYIPKTVDEFLNRYDRNNHLKSNYLLNLESNDTIIRANYMTDHRIYEIKMIHRFFDENRIDIVIVDDITQIKDDERRQKDLAANVSHELKTPLTVIRASEFFVNNITPEKMPSYEEITKWGNRIVANAVRMQDIVQDFLILSMCSQVVPMTIIDLGEVITKAVNNLSDYPNRDKVNIKVPENMYYPLLFGNANLVMRIIINLLTNAIKYINYEGKTAANEISIEVESIGDRIGIMITDNGRGIPAQDIDHLFERFYRVDNSGSHDVGGSGIGLAIAKDVADMHDGTISVTSEIGNGSTFTLVLPQAAGVFKNVYDDAGTGIVSDNQYYRNAAEFMAIQAVEAVRSMGYDDAEGEASAFENIKEGEKTAHDKAVAALFTKLGEERYTDLVDELTYIEPEMDEEFDDEGFDDEEAENLIDDLEIDDEEIAETEESEEHSEPESAEDDAGSEIDEEEEEIKKQKEEARKLLTQPILPRAAQVNTTAHEPVRITPEKQGKDEISKERVMIHPNNDGKMYNSSGKKGSRKKSGLFDNLTKPKQEAPEEKERQSAVRQVLDTATPIQPSKKQNEGESN